MTLADLSGLLAANAAYAARFRDGSLASPPRLGLAILTCMDARIDPMRMFDLAPGDAHVVRNAGGRAQDALRSLAISHAVLGTSHVVVVHHTDCGLLGTTNADLRTRFAARGVDAGAIDFLPFDDLDESVREDMARLRASALLADGVRVDGFVYDVRTGLVRPVP